MTTYNFYRKLKAKTLFNLILNKQNRIENIKRDKNNNDQNRLISLLFKNKIHLHFLKIIVQLIIFLDFKINYLSINLLALSWLIKVYFQLKTRSM